MRRNAYTGHLSEHPIFFFWMRRNKRQLGPQATMPDAGDGGLVATDGTVIGDDEDSSAATPDGTFADDAERPDDRAGFKCPRWRGCRCIGTGRHAPEPIGLDACATPAEGQYVAAPCSYDQVGGTDSVLADCTSPEVGQFVTAPCTTGDIQTVGSDTQIAACALPDNGQCLAVCVGGDIATTGTDTAFLPCIQPADGDYISTACAAAMRTRTGWRNSPVF